MLACSRPAKVWVISSAATVVYQPPLQVRHQAFTNAYFVNTSRCILLFLVWPSLWGASFPQRVKDQKCVCLHVCMYFFFLPLCLSFLLYVLFLSSVQSGWPLWIEGRADSMEKVDWWLIVQPDSARPNWLGCDPVLALCPLIFFFFYFFLFSPSFFSPSL